MAKTVFEDTVNLGREKLSVVATKTGATLTLDTCYGKFSVDVSQKDLAILMRDSLSVTDSQDTRTRLAESRALKMQREAGNDKRWYGKTL